MPDDRDSLDHADTAISPAVLPSGHDDTVAHTPVPTGAAGTVPAVHSSAGARLARLDVERYKMGELLGKGGMGEVVLAFDEQLGRDVAIKRIRSEHATGELLSRFLREARVQGRLQHPAVVPVHDLAFDKDGRPYFVMKRLSGTTMADLLRANDPADGAARLRLLRAFIDVCLAIEFAHKAGIVHRDLKPANIMLGDFGEVYVLDWGVARALNEPGDSGTMRVSKEVDLQLETGETQAGAVLGTPAYMAPEQLVGEKAGPAADLYALGCILFEIVAGRVLHEGRRNLNTLINPVDARPSHVRADAPPELDTICMRATEVDMAERYPSARALGDAVQAFLDGDRDLALRREHAQRHIAAAREALAPNEGEASRRAAMREAGRALALDPTAAEAAEIVTQLMLQPPQQVPHEVDERLARMDTDSAKMQGRLAALSTLGYLGFVPLLLWTGVRDMTFVIALAALAIGCGLQVWMLTRRDHIPASGIYTSVVINALIIATVTRIMGPFVVAPTIVMTTLMAYAAHPRFGSIKIVSVMLASAVAVPWLLEQLGVIASTYRFTAEGELVLSSPVITFSALPVQLAFAGLLVILVTLVAVLVRGMARQQRQAARTIELQAWHLRQLVPTRD